MDGGRRIFSSNSSHHHCHSPPRRPPVESNHPHSAHHHTTPPAPPSPTAKRRKWDISTENPSRSKHHGHHKHHEHHASHSSRSPLAPLNGDSSVEQQLRAALKAESKKRRKAERRARQAQAAARVATVSENEPAEVADGDIQRPKCSSKTKMSVVRAHLGYDKPKWNALESSVHQALFAARLDWDAAWPSQDPLRIARAFRTVKDEFPETARFQGLWGLHRIAKQFWNNRNSSERAKKNPNSYRSRHAHRRSQGENPPVNSSRSPSPVDSSRSPSPVDSRRSPSPVDSRRSPSPVASASSAPPRPRRIPARRVPPSDDEEEAESQNGDGVSAEGHDGDADGEGDE